MRSEEEKRFDLLEARATALEAFGVWSAWNVTRTGWTDVGAAPTVSGRYCVVGNLVLFQIKVDPDTTTAAAAGTSYTNLPVACGASAVAGDAVMTDMTSLVAIGVSVIDTANSRCYVPSQLATADTVLIAGWYER